MTNDHADAVRNHYAEAASAHLRPGAAGAARRDARVREETSTSMSGWTRSTSCAIRRRRALPRDEIRDPLGEPLEAYQLLAAQLDDLTDRLARLHRGARVRGFGYRYGSGLGRRSRWPATETS